MANDDHIALLKEGVAAWNAWRRKYPAIRPNLEEANLKEADLKGANFSDTNLKGADLSAAYLSGANFKGADLSGARLGEALFFGASLEGVHDASTAHHHRAYLNGANFNDANLKGANFGAADLSGANFKGADLSGASLSQANLLWADLSGADLSKAILGWANLIDANLSGTDLRGADLEAAQLVGTDLTGADLTGCRIYGASAWNLKLEGAKQQSLVITDKFEPEISVDNIEVAQFVHLLLHNPKIRDVIDTITSKAVLILGRFTAERKAVLDALRDELRKRDYLPILFDFDKPASKDLTGTVTTLANMVRFIVADGTDPKSIPHELATIVPTTIVPVKPILLASEREYAMFGDLQRRYHWVLPTHRYERQEQLIADLDLCVIRPAAEKAEELRKTVSI